MKIRKCFVSNSSSLSFVCDICGEEICGMDIGLADGDMWECEEGHIFCDSHMANNDEMEKDEEEGEEIDRYELNSKYCPICQFKSLTTKDLATYLSFINEKTEKEVLEEIKNKYSSYKEFKKAIEKYEK